MKDIQAQEREILRLMHKVLANIIKDTTPVHRSMKHPLSDATITQIRDCLSLIAAREKVLAEAAGVVSGEKPYFIDEKRPADVVSIDSVRRRDDC